VCAYVVMTVSRFTRAAFAAVSRLAPSAASRLALRRFLRPPRHRPSARTAEFLATGTQQTLRLGGQRIKTWQWGNGPRVALVHGWGGVGGQLSSFVSPLVAEGFSVVTFDAPGHGMSDGRETPLLHFADAIEVVAANGAPLHGVIAHSLGAAATACALSRGLTAQRVAFIGPPSRPSQWIRIFGAQIGVSETVIRLMYDDVLRYVQSDWDALETIRLAPRLAVPLLVVHDLDDDNVPIGQGVELVHASPDAHLITTRGLGHWRILRDPDVIAAVTNFVMTPDQYINGRRQTFTQVVGRMYAGGVQFDGRSHVQTTTPDAHRDRDAGGLLSGHTGPHAEARVEAYVARHGGDGRYERR
jgi:pimeloyl-ACP methyl ester carboxylesterase